MAWTPEHAEGKRAHTQVSALSEQIGETMIRGGPEAAEALLGWLLKEVLVNEETGKLHPLVIVSEKGSAFKSSMFALLGQPARA